MVMVVETAAAVQIEHVLDPRCLAIFRRVQQVFRERRRQLPAFHNQLPIIGRQTFVVVGLTRLDRRDDGQGSLQQMGARVVEDEGEILRLNPCFRVAIVAADMIGSEIVEVFDEDFFGKGEEAEEGGEFVVVGGLFNVGVAAVEPVDEELKRGVVVFGEVELFGLGFGELALERRTEVLGAVAEQNFVEAECLALWTDEDIDLVDGHEPREFPYYFQIHREGGKYDIRA